ncbi:hypothetical protein EJB05_00551, partial [Eragrostis curvula]
MVASSRCLTRDITATHNFEVTNFSLLDGMGIGEYISSSTFSVGSFDWKLNFYPDGDDAEQEAAYASVFLCLAGGPTGARVRFKFTLFDKDYKVSRKRGKRRKTEKEENLLKTEASTFDSVGQEWGCSDFFDKSVLRELLLSSDDCIRIKCSMSVIKVDTEESDTIEVPPSNLHLDLARMLKDGEDADVAFRVGDQMFHAHRNILAARSMVFKVELFGAMMENATECIEIKDMEPTVFEGLLHFIYTDSLPCNWKSDSIVAVQQLLAAADRYGLDRLMAMCGAKLCSWIDVQSVATTLALAEQHNYVKLKDACLRFIGWPDVLSAVIKTEGFEHLCAVFPLATKEILEKAVVARMEKILS